MANIRENKRDGKHGERIKRRRNWDRRTLSRLINAMTASQRL